MKASPGTYTRAPAQKRELLLQAARTLFVERGFEATSTQMIAKEAGVSEGILFHHFGSKRGLFEALVDDFVRAGRDASIPADAMALTEEQVVRAAFDFADANPALYTMLHQISLQLGDAQHVARSDVIIDAIEAQLRAAMATGQIRQGDARIMAQLQFAVVDGAYRAWRDSGDPKRREAYIDEAINCMRAMLIVNQ
ncbi:MAG: TetR family transcriptional regulator [Pseudomonadota bacterium]